MNEYQALKEEQTAAFERHLVLMTHRRRVERRRDCAVTFLENPPDEKDGKDLSEVARANLVLADVADQAASGLGSDSILVSDQSGKAENHGGAEDRSDRYLQFAFMKHSFYLDLPCNTLFVAEARQLMAQRSGFFYLKDRRWPFMSLKDWQDLVQKWNPVQKEYLNSDTRAAAEDMAFIIFMLWKFPVDWDFYYRALVFGNARRKWEGEGCVG